MSLSSKNPLSNNFNNWTVQVLNTTEQQISFRVDCKTHGLFPGVFVFHFSETGPGSVMQKEYSNPGGNLPTQKQFEILAGINFEGSHLRSLLGL